MRNGLVRLLGWRSLFLHGDPCVYDRYRWTRSRLRGGHLKTLDAGAGNGGFAIFAASLGNDTLGLSFDEAEMTAARARATLCGVGRVRFEVTDLRDFENSHAISDGFDQILCLEVAEHLLDDARLFRNLSGALNPGGRLLLTTPFDEHRPLLGEHLSETEDGGHVRWGYSDARLRELCAQAGLTPVEMGHVSGIVSQKLTDLQRRLAAVDDRLAWAVVFPLRVAQLLDRALTRLLRYPYLSIALVAERPSRA